MFQTIDLSTANGKLFTLVASVFALGTCVMVVLALAAIVATVYLVTIALDALCELSSHIAFLYTHSDSLTKLFLFVIVGYCLKKALPFITTKMGRVI